MFLHKILLMIIAVIALVSSGMTQSLSQTEDTLTGPRLDTNELTILSTSNASLIHSTSVTCVSPGLLNPTVDDTVIPCDCFGSGSGQDRYYMVLAVELFCERTSGRVWSGADLGRLTTAYQDYWYNKDNTIEGISVILVKLDDWADQLGTQDQCNSEFVIDYDTCVKSMHVPLDQCDAKRENGKHGGQATSACLLWTVDSNPSSNNPEIYSSLTMPPSVWPTPPAKL